MNRLHNDLRERERHLAADVTACLDDLFLRWPALHGFSVLEGAVCGVTCYPEPREDEAAELRDEISTALRELVEERPEAAELLGGRTFARILH